MSIIVKCLLLLSAVLCIVAYLSQTDHQVANIDLNDIKNAPPSEKFELIHEIPELINQKLHKGMTKDEVRNLIGEPQNTDDKYIWLWSEKLDPSTPDFENLSHENNWISLTINRNNYYLMFYNEKLICQDLVWWLSENPHDLLSLETELTRKQAMELLSLKFL